MQDSSLRHRTTGAAGVAPSLLHTKDSRHHLAFVCILAGVAVGAAAAISTGIYMGRHQEGKHVTPFCCPDLARELAWYLNDSIDPCRDFFSYVCSNVIRNGQRPEDDLDIQLAQALITGASSKAVQRGDVGRFLTSFYRSCVKTLPHPKSFFQSLAHALVHDLWEHQGQVDTRKAILYFFSMAIKYDLPSAVSVSLLSKDRSTVVMKSREICTVSTHYYEAMTSVVNSLNQRANATTVSSESAFQFRDALCKALLSSPRKTRRYSTHNESHLIQAELWNVEDLAAGFSVYGSSARSMRFVNVLGVRQIRLIHDEFASEKRNSTAANLRVAFLVWHSVVHGTEDYYVMDHFSLRMIFSFCRTAVLEMREFWDTFTAEMLTSREKDAASEAVFSAVKRSVYADVRASLLFDADDAERLRGFFENLVLVTPIEASQISVVVPNATESFGENILRGHSYGFLVAKEREANLTDVSKVVYQEVHFLGEKQLFLSSRVYGYISAGSSDYELPNNARLGRLLAEAIWYMTLVKIEWTDKSRDEINRFKKCFVENYLGDRKTDVTDTFIVNVLGLSSVVKALNKSDWQTLKPAWSLWRISNAQFFFMLSTYYGCPWFWFPKIARVTNVSLLYNEEFAAAFQCSFIAPMAKIHQCFVSASHVPKKELEEGNLLS